MNRYAFAYLGEVEIGVAQFDCGEPELNFFLHNEAEHYVKTGLSFFLIGSPTEWPVSMLFLLTV